MLFYSILFKTCCAVFLIAERTPTVTSVGADVVPVAAQACDFQQLMVLSALSPDDWL